MYLSNGGEKLDSKLHIYNPFGKSGQKCISYSPDNMLDIPSAALPMQWVVCSYSLQITLIYLWCKRTILLFTFPMIVMVIFINTIAGDGIDYDSGPYVVKFPAKSTSATFDVSVNDDKLLETDEIFSLNIGSSSLPRRVFGSRILIFPGQTTVLIIDDDKQGKNLVICFRYLKSIYVCSLELN